LKVKEKTFVEKSGKWGFQTKDFDFIPGHVLTDSIVLINEMRRHVRRLY
jgi:hypothetical protein